MGELDMEVSALVLQAVLQAQEDETKKSIAAASALIMKPGRR